MGVKYGLLLKLVLRATEIMVMGIVFGPEKEVTKSLISAVNFSAFVLSKAKQLYNAVKSLSSISEGIKKNKL
jgi:hypothetical protein